MKCIDNRIFLLRETNAVLILDLLIEIFRPNFFRHKMKHSVSSRLLFSPGEKNGAHMRRFKLNRRLERDSLSCKIYLVYGNIWKYVWKILLNEQQMINILSLET